jgi:hypothetical protein
LIANVDRDTLRIGLAAYEEEQRRLAEEQRQLAAAQEWRKQIEAQKARKIFVRAAVAAVAVIAIFIVLTTVIIPHGKYSAAQNLLFAKKYDEAIAAYTALGDYKDAPDMIASAQVQKQNALNQAAYEAAEQLLASGD